MSELFQHTSVLLNESLQALAIKPDGVYVDATFGRGGHSREILQRLGEKGRLLAIDRDPQAIEQAQQFAEDRRFTMLQGPFSQLSAFLAEQNLIGKVDGILFDLGVSSPQLDDPARGFSFMRDGPLDMRMDPSSGISAATWLQQVEHADLTYVLKVFGEEKFARRIAQAIIDHREDPQQPPLNRTSQLAALIAQAMPRHDRHKHPATRSFQAIRIYVNRELEEIEQAMQAALAGLAPEGRLAVISFHSLEDRLVKRFMRQASKGPDVPPNIPLTQAQIAQLGQADLKLVGKAIKATAAERDDNPRARSAILRIAEKLPQYNTAVENTA